RFPSESTSLGFGRVIVELSLLGKLAHSAIEVIFHGDEIEARLKLAEHRLAGLESLRKARLDAQRCANGRPAAQQKIGTALRDATNLLDGANFTEVEQADLQSKLRDINSWVNKDRSINVEEYQRALIARLQSNQYPDAAKIGTLPNTSEIYKRLDALT